MKQCPSCNRGYPDDTLSFCLDDGTPLIASRDPEATLIINPATPRTLSPPVVQRNTNAGLYVVIALLALLAGGGLVALVKSGARETQLATSANAQPTIAASPATPPLRQQTETEPKPVPTKTPDKVFALPADRAGWFPIGTGDFTVEATGEIDFGGRTSTPIGSSIVGQDPLSELTEGKVLSSNLPYGALIGKIGHGKPFLVGIAMLSTLSNKRTSQSMIPSILTTLEAIQFEYNGNLYGVSLLLSMRRRTSRWTGAAGACFVTCLVRRRLNEIAPPGQLNRSTATCRTEK